MAIEPYRQRIGVTPDRSVINPNVGRFQDVGNALTETAQTLMRTQEPRLQHEADQAAIRDAGSANIVKDESGQFVRPPAPPGGGSRYVEAYDRLIRERHAQLVTGDFEQQLDRISNDPANFMDPEAFMAAATGRANGVLTAVPADIRPQVEQVLTREISERFRGIGHRVASNDRQVLVAGLADQMRANDARGLDILRLGGADAEARAEQYFAAGRAARAGLVEIHEMNANSVAAGELTQTMNAETNSRYGRSLDTSRAITSRMATLTTPQLQTLEMWGSGVATDPHDTVLGYTFDTFSRAIQEPELARRVGVISGGIARDRIAEQRRIEDIAREEARAAEDRAALTTAIANGFDANYTYDERQQRALDNRFIEAVGAQPTTPVDQYMGTPEGRQRAVAFAAETGYMPTTVRDYIESRIYSAGAPAVAELAQNMRNLVTREGVQQGYRLFQTLSPKTRAAIGLVEVLRRGGENERVIATRVDAFLRERAPAHQEIFNRFTNSQGQNIYAETRDGAIRRVLHLEEGDRIPGPVQGDFNELIRWNLDIFNGDTTRAANETARQIASGWSRNPVFLGGIAPRHFSSLPLTVGTLDQAFLGGRRGIPPGTTFSPNTPGPRARLETLDIGPQAGIGRFRVHVYAPNGHEMGAFDVDADQQLRQPLQRAIAERRTQGAAAVQQAREQHAREQAFRERLNRIPAPVSVFHRGRDY